MLYQAFDVLDYALVSSPGAPVKQALIDAGIGDDVYGSYDAGILQPVFSFVAKNANASQADEFESIIETLLKRLLKQELIKKHSLRESTAVSLSSGRLTSDSFLRDSFLG